MLKDFTDFKSRMAVKAILTKHFEPLALTRFLIVGFDRNGKGFLITPEMGGIKVAELKEMLRSMVESISSDDDAMITVGDRSNTVTCQRCGHEFMDGEDFRIYFNPQTEETTFNCKKCR